MPAYFCRKPLALFYEPLEVSCQQFLPSQSRTPDEPLHRRPDLVGELKLSPLSIRLQI
jgi:hypothetical protein